MAQARAGARGGGAELNGDLRHSDLSTVLAEGRLISEESRRAFWQLSAEQINWKPGAQDWSVGQCFDHLIVSNRPYVELVDDIQQGHWRPGIWERVAPFSWIFGRLLVRALRPDSGRSLKARRAFYPSSSAIAPSIVATFLEQQHHLLTLMEATRGLDLEGIVIRSPVLGFVTYSLMDAYRIIVVHEQNHVVQARRVTEWRGFPPKR